MRSSPIARHHQVEQFAGAADERPAGNVFLVAGRLADEHDAALRIAVGENELGRGRAQRAALEIDEERAQFIQRLGASRGLARRHDRDFGRSGRLALAAPATAIGGGIGPHVGSGEGSA